jgi:pimeloyl-ACP methyl ester carboxylesterase
VQCEFLNVKGIDIAYRRINNKPQNKPEGVLWLGGFNSNMLGSKATALHDYCLRADVPFTRFDYSGHGQSGGDFEQGCISLWLEEAQALAQLVQPSLLIASSMGAWIALLLARNLPLKGMILLAPAPDFTSKLMWPSFNAEAKAILAREGKWRRPSAYSPEGYVITQKLLNDGLHNSVMDAPIKLTCPVHILQGTQDEDVPLAHALQLFHLFEGDEARLTLLKDGDHSLSRPEDIAVLIENLECFLSPKGKGTPLTSSRYSPP